jgi:BirA family biotin operon repressor/biotin-[acetyl-CoA-carboxylase] ligase
LSDSPPPFEEWPAGYDRIVLDEVDSTNAEAARVAATLGKRTWIMARHQTAAHGRRGRPWAMAPRNFAATLALRIEAPPQQAAQRSFLAALAVHEALTGVTDQPDVLTLKWPNDVLLNGGKVAGILLENRGGAGPQLLSIGIGINLAAAPDQRDLEDGALRAVSILGETAVEVEPEAFLLQLALAYARWEDLFNSHGFTPIREAWLSRAAGRGAPATARVGDATHKGTFETLDDTGALVLETPGGRVTVPAGDVYF